MELDILHGNADGSFNTTPIANQPLQGGMAALGNPTAILDINGDGIPDIVGQSSGPLCSWGEGNLKSSAYPLCGGQLRSGWQYHEPDRS